MTKEEAKQKMERQQDPTSRISPHDANNRNANTHGASEDTINKHRLDNSKKLFFTTTDLLDKINLILSSSAVTDCNNDPSKQKKDNDEDGQQMSAPCFELQRRLPDGSTRKATAQEAAAADFQAKLKQSAELVSQLSSREEKLKWAQKQRQAGNELYAQQQYQEAMDVYLTCLVAMEGMSQHRIDENKCIRDELEKNGSVSSDVSSKNSSSCWKQVTEEQIQLPVLLNLSACTLKLDMYKKTKIFCDLAIDLPAGKKSPKAFFRRAKAYMFMGSYQDAKRDWISCLGLVKNGAGKNGGEGTSDLDLARVERELSKLELLIQRAEANRQRQKEAMQRVFSGKLQKGNGNADKDDDKHMKYTANLCAVEDAPSENEFRQYNGDHKYREYSTLRAPWYYKVKEEETKKIYQQKQVTIMGVVQSISLVIKIYLCRFLDWITNNKKRKKSLKYCSYLKTRNND